jgi:hypothetical protein
MKYALLIYTDPTSWTSLSDDEQRSISAEYFAIRDEAGVLDGAQLGPAHTATTVRVSGGSALTTDGPFADTKEVFAGYYLLEADDLDRALEVAARVPAARMGGAVEVRPLVEVEAYS